MTPRLPHTRTLGPRGDVGVNPRAVYHALGALPYLIEVAKQTGNARFNTNNSGEQWILSYSRKMGGRTQANARRRNLNNTSNVNS